jgi:hypothetical protein
VKINFAPPHYDKNDTNLKEFRLQKLIQETLKNSKAETLNRQKRYVLECGSEHFGFLTHHINMLFATTGSAVHFSFMYNYVVIELKIKFNLSSENVLLFSSFFRCNCLEIWFAGYISA